MSKVPSSRLIVFAALLLSSNPCTSASAAPTPSAHPDVSGIPPLPGLSSLSYHVTPGTRTQALPTDIADLLLSLSSNDLDLPAGMVQAAVNKAKASIIDVPRIAGRHDRLISAYAPGGASLWVRTFESENSNITGYLVQVDIECRALLDLPKEESLETVQTQCFRKERSGVTSQLRAYLKIGNRPVTDITGTITPPEKLLGADVMHSYLKATASPPFPDATRLNKVPVIRWKVEADPENPLRKDAHTFGKGSFAHAGFLLWNGDHFETRTTVPATLWPCIDKTPQKDSWACPKDDRFVIGRKR